MQAELVAYDANGVELARQQTSPGEPEGPTPEIDAAWTLLRSARDELARYGAKQAFDELLIVANESTRNIDYVVWRSAEAGRMSGPSRCGSTTDRHLVALTQAETGEIYCVGMEIAEDGGATIRYGSLNALTYDDCSGGWS